MARSPLILAALAKAAKADLSLARTVELTSGNAGYFDAALITDQAGENYVLRMPRNSRAYLDLQTELHALKALRAVAGSLPFEFPRLLGSTKDSDGVPAILLSYVYGGEIDIANLSGTDAFATNLGTALAALHNLPASVVEQAGLPIYTSSDVVKQKVALMDRAAATGLVPAALLQRWETALEDVNLFRFTPTVVHGELTGGTVLEEQGQVGGVLGWNHLQVGDPAEDFVWVVGYGLPDFSYAVLHAYSASRAVDSNLQQRAQLYSELNYAQWLVSAVESKDEANTEFYAQTLHNLNAHLEEAEALAMEPTPLAAETSLAAGDRMTSDDFLLAPAFADSPSELPMPELEPEARDEGFLSGIELGQVADESTPTRPMPVIQIPDEDPAPSRDKDELF